MPIWSCSKCGIVMYSPLMRVGFKSGQYGGDPLTGPCPICKQVTDWFRVRSDECK